MTLGETQVGQMVVIETVGGPRGFRRRLMELGLIPGTPVELLAVAPLGDPVKLRVRGCTLSIRKAEACCIQVKRSPSIAPAVSPSMARLEVGISA